MTYHLICTISHCSHFADKKTEACRIWVICTTQIVSNRNELYRQAQLQSNAKMTAVLSSTSLWIIWNWSTPGGSSCKTVNRLAVKIPQNIHDVSLPPRGGMRCTLVKIIGSGCPSLYSGSVCLAGSFAAPPDSQSWGTLSPQPAKAGGTALLLQQAGFLAIKRAISSPCTHMASPFSLNLLHTPCHQTVFALSESPQTLT